MVIWRITGNNVGHDNCGAAHFATRAEAERAIRAHREWCKENDQDSYVSGPEKLVISNREQLAEALDHAMGFGGS